MLLKTSPDVSTQDLVLLCDFLGLSDLISILCKGNHGSFLLGKGGQAMT